jgi:hypothetical protein
VAFVADAPREEDVEGVERGTLSHKRGYVEQPALRISEESGAHSPVVVPLHVGRMACESPSDQAQPKRANVFG